MSNSEMEPGFGSGDVWDQWRDKRRGVVTGEQEAAEPVAMFMMGGDHVAGAPGDEEDEAEAPVWLQANHEDLRRRAGVELPDDDLTAAAEADMTIDVAEASPAEVWEEGGVHEPDMEDSVSGSRSRLGGFVRRARDILSGTPNQGQVGAVSRAEWSPPLPPSADGSTYSMAAAALEEYNRQHGIGQGDVGGMTDLGASATATDGGATDDDDDGGAAYGAIELAAMPQQRRPSFIEKRRLQLEQQRAAAAARREESAQRIAALREQAAQEAEELQREAEQQAALHRARTEREERALRAERDEAAATLDHLDKERYPLIAMQLPNAIVDPADSDDPGVERLSRFPERLNVKARYQVMRALGLHHDQEWLAGLNGDLAEIDGPLFEQVVQRCQSEAMAMLEADEADAWRYTQEIRERVHETTQRLAAEFVLAQRDKAVEEMYLTEDYGEAFDRFCDYYQLPEVVRGRQLVDGREVHGVKSVYDAEGNPIVDPETGVPLNGIEQIATALWPIVANSREADALSFYGAGRRLPERQYREGDEDLGGFFAEIDVVDMTLGSAPYRVFAGVHPRHLTPQEYAEAARLMEDDLARVAQHGISSTALFTPPFETYVDPMIRFQAGRLYPAHEATVEDVRKKLLVSGRTAIDLARDRRVRVELPDDYDPIGLEFSPTGVLEAGSQLRYRVDGADDGEYADAELVEEFDGEDVRGLS